MGRTIFSYVHFQMAGQLETRVRAWGKLGVFRRVHQVAKIS